VELCVLDEALTFRTLCFIGIPFLLVLYDICISCNLQIVNFFYIFTTRQYPLRFWALRLSIHSLGQILLPPYLMSGLSSLDETYREYS